MKITGFKTFIVDSTSPAPARGAETPLTPGAPGTPGGGARPPGPQWVFVKVLTSEDGLYGIGEGSVTSKATTIAAAIMELERLVVGRDPLNIEGLWQQMYRIPRWRGGPVLNSAISALDIALWDIKGKAYGQPIYQLLGGACRDRVRMYAHCGGATPEQAAENARRIKAAGYTALKTGSIHVENSLVVPGSGLRKGLEKIAAMRDAVGEDFDIGVDAHGQLTPPMALEFCRRVEPYRPLFVEEPTQPEDLDTLAWLSARSPVPLATGERLFTKWGFAELCGRHLASYIQPDIVHCGGITELRKIAAIAEAHFIDVAPHNPQSWVSTLASIHVDACTPSCVIQEHIAGPSWQADLFKTELKLVDGHAPLPTAPGLGLDFDEAEAARHPYREDLRPEWKWADGSVADW
jgi:galactonate dehydratase